MGTDPKDYVVGPDAVIDDVDLDDEEIYLRDGTRLTERRAEQIAADTLAEIRPQRGASRKLEVHGPEVLVRPYPARQRSGCVGREHSELLVEPLSPGGSNSLTAMS
jgi:hypothetical protein